MAKIKCEKCGNIIEINEAQLDTYQKSVDEAVKAREAEMRRNLLNEFNARENNEIEKLKDKLFDAEKSLKNLEAEQKIQLEKAVSEKEKRIVELEASIKIAENNNQSNIREALNKKEKEILELKHKLDSKDIENKLEVKNLNEKYQFELKSKDDTIAYYKDLKTKLSTKLSGETLEQHCMIEFNQLRTTLYPNAEFHKDNELSDASSSKGDYIFKDFVDGQEYISIMFEMKNEKDETKTKHKNEDFFKELDKDRNEKKCEYAVLVSMLEPESELYNRGIVDVSYEYQKMYVIRPQLFVTMITLLANAAKKTVEARKELALYKEQNIGIIGFETKLQDAKNSLKISLDNAGKNFTKAIEDIDKSIKVLEDTKTHLLRTIEGFHTAESKMEGITIRKLTYGNPTMQEKFKKLQEEKDEEN